MARNPTSPFERRAKLIAALHPGDPLVSAAYEQFKRDYAATGSPAASFLALTDAGFDPITGDPAGRQEQAAVTPTELFYFEMSLADRVRLTSTRSAGGDWHWRLCTAGGTAVAHGGSYRTEAECRAAISLVQRVAGAATIRQR
jgi:uncharacterized protein YegP (UPF0339 family)